MARFVMFLIAITLVLLPIPPQGAAAKAPITAPPFDRARVNRTSDISDLRNIQLGNQRLIWRTGALGDQTSFTENPAKARETVNWVQILSGIGLALFSAFRRSKGF